jgi:two-component system, OmpR family, osmolarity sensor histidine kinase EnvZ
VKLLPLPMFWRSFVALVVLTVVASALFGAILGGYQERVTANTLARLWAAAIRAERQQVPAAPHRLLDVPLAVPVFTGEPPERAYTIASDPRSRALADALAALGVSLSDTRLDDTAEPPVTWLRVQPVEGAGYWIGFEGGLQPSLFRARTWSALGGLVLLMAAAAWIASRWVSRPLARLVRQVDQIGQGGVPMETVRGAREIEKLGAALGAMAKQRAAFDEQRRVMLLGVSHDLRSPLTRIRVAADLLDEQAPLRELIVRNVEHADAIIESFLSYVRSDAEVLDDAVDLSAVAGSAARLADLPLEQVRIEPGIGVRGNTTMLQRLFANLLDNAARHGAAPISLSLTADRDARLAKLVVEDHGPGIVDPKRMLQPFERGDASRANGGAGLGLAIVSRIVERLGGSLRIGTADGGGARVCVELPLA